MAGIMIQGGCVLLSTVGIVNNWVYRFANGAEAEQALFTADVGMVPQIGDTIVNGILVKRDGFIINNDPGFQAKKPQEETWPIDRKNAL